MRFLSRAPFAVALLCVACGVGCAEGRYSQRSRAHAGGSTKSSRNKFSTPKPSSGIRAADAGPPDASSDPDDTASIQRLLNAGNIVKLRPGLTYHISRRLDVTINGSGIVSEGTPATLKLKRSFDNVNGDEVYALDVRSDSIGIYVGDGVSGVTVKNLVMQKDALDGTYVTAIALRGASQATLQELDISGFSLGGIVSLDSVDSVVVKDTYIHDSWANRYFLVPDENGLTRFPQLTGIVIDDNRLSVAGRPRTSRNVRIINNTIRRLRFGRDLYSQPRVCFRGTGVTITHCAEQTIGSLAAYCEAHPCPIVHYQTDGINVMSPGRNFLIDSNTIDTVGEGIDLINNDGTLVSRNNVSKAFAYGIKLVHGTTNVLAEKNFVADVGIAGLSVAGTTIESLGDTLGNVMRFNRLSGVGNIGAYCAPSIQAPFRIFDSCSGLTEDAAAIEISPNNLCADDGTECRYGIPKFNFFFQNYIQATRDAVNMGAALELQERVANNVFYGNVLDDSSGRNMRYAAQSDRVGNANVIDTRGPDSLFIADVNGDQKPDKVFHWNATGRNDLYLSRSDGLFDVINEVFGTVPP